MCHFRIVTQVKMYLPKGRQSGQNAHKIITVINDRCTRLADKYGFIFLVEEKALSKKFTHRSIPLIVQIKNIY